MTIERFEEQRLLREACQTAWASGLSSDQIRGIERLQEIACKQASAVSFLREETHARLQELNNAIHASNLALGRQTTEVLIRLSKIPGTSTTAINTPSTGTFSPDLDNLNLQEIIEEQKKIIGDDFGQVPLLKSLMKLYLRPREHNALHIRRTLDQFYYPSLPDDRTKSRDEDQVVFRYQRRRLKEADGNVEPDDVRFVSLCLYDSH